MLLVTMMLLEKSDSCQYVSGVICTQSRIRHMLLQDIIQTAATQAHPGDALQSAPGTG